MLLSRWCLLACLLFTTTDALANETAPLPPATTPIPKGAAVLRFEGEELNYGISFLWFDRLASGRLSFKAGETPGTYRAELVATTLGVASWLTGDRVQRYLTEMELQADGRLRTNFQESWVSKGTGKNRREKGKRYRFDYQARTVRMERLGVGAGEEAVLPLVGEELPNDFLTAFYNFRAGSFGPLEPGKTYSIPTFTRKGKAEIGVQLLTDAQRPDDRFFPPGGLLAKVQLDPEVLDTSGGAVYVWFDTEQRPARAVVENVLSLGHVRGVLLHK